MARALKLARKGLYITKPNPAVGCVITKDNKILAEGWTQKAGKAHAEAHAIYQASSNLKGSTVYVTLEPCSHHGRTPPCTDALIKAGVSRIVVSVGDPNPRVNGDGLRKLAQAGIQVETGLLETEARNLNKGFFSLHERFRPWVRVKTAASMDGRTAMSNGQSKWITSEFARNDGHKLRAQSDAVLTGINTILADDPSLNVRLDGVDRQPIRIILDSNLQTPDDAKLFQHEGEVLILTCVDANSRLASMLKSKGANVLQIESERGRLNLSKVLETLAAMNIGEIHVEAGSILTGEIIRQQLADELVIYLAPTLLGDASRGMFNIPGLTDLDQQQKLSWVDQRKVGNDLRLIMRLSE